MGKKKSKIEGDNLSKVVDNLSQQLQSTQSGEQTKSESAQAIEELNKDSTDDKGMAEIDFKTELSHNQAMLLTKLDSLSRLGFLSEEDIEVVTRTLQRKLVSLNRKGRAEAIQLHQQIEGKKDNLGFWEKWFKPKE